MPVDQSFTIITILKEWLWVPFSTFWATAFGFHLKWQHEEKKDNMDKFDLLHSRITKECVTKDELKKVEDSLSKVEDGVTWLTRNRPPHDKKHS